MTFLSRVHIDLNGCWIWTGSLDRGGYPKVKTDGRWVGGHRLLYEIYVGTIPDGYEVDHLCFTPACVNPAHLEAVTQEENERRAWEARRFKAAAANAAKTHCLRGHPFDERNTYVTKTGNRQCRACQVERKQQRRDPAPTSCRQCGDPLHRGHGRPRLYCSRSCRRRGERRRAKGRGTSKV